MEEKEIEEVKEWLNSALQEHKDGGYEVESKMLTKTINLITSQKKELVRLKEKSGKYKGFWQSKIQQLDRERKRCDKSDLENKKLKEDYRSGLALNESRYASEVLRLDEENKQLREKNDRLFKMDAEKLKDIIRLQEENDRLKGNSKSEPSDTINYNGKTGF